MTVTLPRSTDACPCQSGRDFRRCCRLEIAAARRVLSGLGTTFQTFPEKFVVGLLKRDSIPFAQFYQDIRPKITGTVYWVHNDNLPEGVKGMAESVPGNRNVMHLRNIPAVDAMNAAHELAHVIFRERGMPRVFTTPEYPMLGPTLSSMVHDLLVNDLLSDYGFDIGAAWNQEIDASLRELEKLGPPTNDIDRTHWTLRYAEHVLDLELVHRKGYAVPDRFRPFADTRFPDIAQAGMRFVVLVKAVGYDTPEKVGRIFEKVIQDLGLAKYGAILRNF